MARLAGTESVSVMTKHFVFRVETVRIVVSLDYENGTNHSSLLSRVWR
jgi:hypothetical protein